ncbi:MAG: cytochrome c biogenesis protein ResB [Phaeodactylibacter sp.]|nr:cytochrome c biogenesis protein ResB [Phaeodactylibacter sp.]
MKILKSILNKLFSTTAAGLYMVLFAVAIGAATFVENDFGTSSAQKLIFKSWWMELLLVLFGISILVNIFRFRLIQQKKWAIFAFHAAILVILLGAAVTRYTGFEGVMHIREGDTSNTFLSAGTYLNFEAIHQGKKYSFDEPVLFASLGNNHWKRSYLLGGREIAVEVLEFMPNPQEIMVQDDNGVPVLKAVIGGANGREEYFIRYGDKRLVRGTLFNFRKEEDPLAFNIKYEDGNLFFKAPTAFAQTQMATQQQDMLPPAQYHPLLLRSLYTNGQESFVFGDFSPKARIEITSAGRKMESASTAGLLVKASDGANAQADYVYGTAGVEGRPRAFAIGDLQLSVAYGAKRVELPFALQLRDFIMEKYPGRTALLPTPARLL